MAKLNATKIGDGYLFRVTIPPDHIYNLGWNKFPTRVIVESDKEKQQIIIKRVEYNGK